MNISGPEDLALINQLIDRGLVEKTTLIGMLESQREAYEQQEQQLRGKLFLIDPQAQQLRVMDLAQDSILYQRELPHSKSRPGDWEKWGSHLALLHLTGGSQQAALDWELSQPYGLVMSESGVYNYDPRGVQAEWLGHSHSRLYGGVCKGNPSNGPYDLHISPDGELLALCDRGAGVIEILSTASCETRLQIKLRPPGGSGALNLAFDLARERLLITDQSSSQISMIDLKSGELSQHKPGLGILGNLVMAPDGEHVYVLSLKPNQELAYLRARDLHVVKTILIKGDLYRNQGSDPCDLLAISPDREHLVAMSYLHAPNPHTPLLTVVDTQQVKAIRRYSLKDGGKPCQLLFAVANPLRPWQHKDLRAMLLASGMVDAATLEAVLRGDPPAQNFPPAMEIEDFRPDPYLAEIRSAMPTSMPTADPAPDQAQRQPLPAPRVETQSPATQAMFSPAEPVELDPWNLITQALDTSPTAEAQSNTEASPESSSEATPAPLIELGADAAERLSELLAARFEARSGFDPSSRPQLMAQLNQEAERLCEVLSREFEATVALDKLAEGHDLKTVVRRRELRLAQAQFAWMRTQSGVIVPLDCPSCHQKLMGHWDCQVCGFELDSPLRRFKRRLGSAEPTVGLAAGHLLLPDPQQRRLIELDARKQVVWQLEADQHSCEYPLSPILLPSGNLLVTDRDRNQIYELGRRGRIHWSLQTFSSPRHQLNSPVRAGYYAPDPNAADLHYLIVDQGHHRVLEVDPAHQIHWEFGEQGQAGDDAQHLDSPSDLQYTSDLTYLICDSGNGRVLEVERETGIERSFDAASYGLVRPVLARRLWNGQTLIVDAGAFQILILDAAGLVSDRISYYKPGMPDELRLLHPSGLLRLANGDLVLYNESRALQLMPRHKKLIWSDSLSALKPKPAEPVTQQAVSPQAAPPVAQVAPPPSPPAPRPPTEKPRPQPISAQDRVQAMLSKRSAPAANQESFEHSVIYTREGIELEALSLYLLDSRHNGIVRINRKGKLTWHYGFEMGQKLARPAYVEESAHALLVTDSDQHRIVEISKADKEIQLVLSGPKGMPLANPRSARRLASGNILIADQRNKRLIELDDTGQRVWELWNEELISSPQYVEELANGHLLMVDSLLNRVTELDRAGAVRWYYGAPLKAQGHAASLFGPSHATRLTNGNTLICDTRNHRVLEVTPEGETAWDYVGHARSSRINPTQARRLDNGNTLITFFNHSKVIEINPQHQCLWSYTLGKDVFLPPVAGDDETLVRQDAEKPTPFYNAVEKRLLETARQEGKQVAELHIELMDNVQMKSVRAQVIMHEVERCGMVFKTFPSPEDVLADRYGRHLILTCILEGGNSASSLAGRVANIAEVVRVEVNQPRLGA